jgi:hypothetical protein
MIKPCPPEASCTLLQPGLARTLLQQGLWDGDRGSYDLMRFDVSKAFHLIFQVELPAL